jgi:hypothetical protein
MRLCVFSSVKWKILDNWKPLKNLLIKRSYRWQSIDYTEETVTDDNWEYFFPNTFKWPSLWMIMPHNPSIGQFIKTEFKWKKIQIWWFCKGSYRIDWELYWKKINLECDINDKIDLYPVSNFKSYKWIGKLVEKL